MNHKMCIFEVKCSMRFTVVLQACWSLACKTHKRKKDKTVRSLPPILWYVLHECDLYANRNEVDVNTSVNAFYIRNKETREFHLAQRC